MPAFLDEHVLLMYECLLILCYVVIRKIKLWSNKLVSNIFVHDSNIVFIAESPYVDEMRLKYPMAGATGKEITKVLLGKESPPLGAICKERAFERYGLTSFSIMNISQFPLEIKAYQTEGYKKLYPNNLDDLMKLKRNIDAQNNKGSNFHEDWKIPRNPSVKELKFRLLDELIENLSNLQAESKIQLIPCGKFARVFVRKALENEILAPHFVMLEDVPHPSRNKWAGMPVAKLKEIQSIVLSSTT